MRTQIIPGLLLLALATPVSAEETNAVYTTEKDQVSYAIGFSIGMNLKRQEFDVDPDIIARGIRDQLDGLDPAMTEGEAQQVLRTYQQQLMKKKQEEMAAEAARNRELGLAWLAENSKKEGVVTLTNGLQYKVLSAGHGESPGPVDTVKVNYRGTLIDGTEFDSSYSRGEPAQFRVGNVIPGWTQALQMMSVGDKWELYIPADLAYGDRAQGPTIKPGSALVFEVELLDIIKPQPITSDIIKVPSAEEMKKGAKIETIKASDLQRIEEEARRAKEQEKAQP